MPKTRTVAVVAAVVACALSLAAAACGGGEEAGSDEEYVAAVCKAQAALQISLEKLSRDPSITTEAQAVKALQPVVDQMVVDFKGARPPADARDYHNKVLKALEAGSKALKEKQSMAAMEAVDPGPPPAGIGARLQAIAENNADCAVSGFRFDE